jgi:hypothetical protein
MLAGASHDDLPEVLSILTVMIYAVWVILSYRKPKP